MPPVRLSQGICFIRTSRPDTAVLYSPEEKFEVGVAKVQADTCALKQIPSARRRWGKTSALAQVVRQSDSDRVTVIGAGVTLHEALAAAETLAREGETNTAL